MVHIYLEKFDQEISIGEHAYQSSQVSLKVKVENTIKTIEELSDEQKTNLSESIRDEIYNILISEFASLIKNQITIDYRIGSIVVVIDLNTSNLTNNVVNIINNNKTTIEERDCKIVCIIRFNRR
jgi:chemotaxis protein CheY-P-specific phosphatase CheC